MRQFRVRVYEEASSENLYHVNLEDNIEDGLESALLEAISSKQALKLREEKFTKYLHIEDVFEL